MAGVQAGIKGGFFSGLLLGFSNLAFLCSFALALWYGGLRVRDGKYTGQLQLHMTLHLICIHIWPLEVMLLSPALTSWQHSHCLQMQLRSLDPRIGLTIKIAEGGNSNNSVLHPLCC